MDWIYLVLVLGYDNEPLGLKKAGSSKKVNIIRSTVFHGAGHLVQISAGTILQSPVGKTLLSLTFTSRLA